MNEHQVKPLLDFRINCVPPKTTSQQKRVMVNRHTGKPTFFHGAKHKEQAQTLSALLAPCVPERIIDQPIHLDVALTYPWRKSDLATKAKRARAEEQGRFRFAGKPDCSNIIKQFEDLLVKMCFIRDDSLVVDLRIAKYVGANPGIQVVAYAVSESELP